MKNVNLKMKNDNLKLERVGKVQRILHCHFEL